ncbi:MAG TPA: GDSL-type esterase/lipase family protein [Phycisphaerales bacterium]
MLHLSCLVLRVLALCLLADPATPSTQPAPQAVPAANTAIGQESRPDKWWIDRHESFNARAKQGAEKGDIDLIFMGDSITQGWEGPGKGVWTEFYAKRNAVNMGISADRTQHLLYRIAHGNLDGLATPKAGHAPKLLVLMIGTNNTASSPTVRSNTAEEINEGVRAVVSAVRAKLPETHILVLAVFPRGETPNDKRTTLEAMNKLLASVADAKTTFLDIGPTLTNPDGTISKDVMPDFLHLSEKGYRLWAEAIEAEIAKHVGAKS